MVIWFFVVDMAWDEAQSSWLCGGIASPSFGLAFTLSYQLSLISHSSKENTQAPVYVEVEAIGARSSYTVYYVWS
jgi:hypothetical protein